MLPFSYSATATTPWTSPTGGDHVQEGGEGGGLGKGKGKGGGRGCADGRRGARVLGDVEEGEKRKEGEDWGGAAVVGVSGGRGSTVLFCSGDSAAGPQ